PVDQLQVIVAILEALFGRRPLHQVGRLLSESAFSVVRIHRQTGRWQGASIASVRSQEPCSDAAEVSVRLVLGNRSLACAMRLDRIGRRWLCSDVQLAG
ncbi:MAG: Rv3235 family protein, partial [Propionibacteriaceae bacterium]|nr:Rv3235 family protein [Propionibacteriaceae bacterium]